MRHVLTLMLAKVAAAVLFKLEAGKIDPIVVPPCENPDESKYRVLSKEELLTLSDRSPEAWTR